MLIFSLFSLSIISLVYSDCVLYNNGTLPPMQATGDYAIPKDYSKEWNGTACPEFKDKLSCCPYAANQAALDNFQKIRTAFGNQGAGCDVCAANIERFFCYFACATDQSDFMRFVEYKEMDVWNTTLNKVVRMNVTSIEIDYNAPQGCDLFKSCSKISFLTEISAGGSAQGFFTFLFDRGVQDSAIYAKVQVVNKGGLIFKTSPHRCNETFPDGKDEFGYEIPGSCPCNFCEDSCLPLDLVPYGSILDGLNYSRVFLAYLFAGLLTVGVNFIRGLRKKKSALSIANQRHLLESSSAQQ